LYLGRGQWSKAMTGLYPEIEPFDHGMLDVGAGNLV
jgi:proline iminopeptidase